MVQVPPVVSAEMAVPPLAGVYCAALTVMAGLVLGVLLASLRSLAVRVKLPAALKAAVMVAVPAAIAVAGGRLAVMSLEVSPTLSLAVLTMFQ